MLVIPIFRLPQCTTNSNNNLARRFRQSMAIPNVSGFVHTLLFCIWVTRCDVFVFFFFQAEDGIRDGDVTGVQTCALPILLPVVASVVRPGATILALVKPQFEVGRGRVGKGGVVRDPALRAEAVAGVRAAAERLGLALRGEAEAGLPGPKGDRGGFLALTRPRERRRAPSRRRPASRMARPLLRPWRRPRTGGPRAVQLVVASPAAAPGGPGQSIDWGSLRMMSAS